MAILIVFPDHLPKGREGFVGIQKIPGFGKPVGTEVRMRVHATVTTKLGVLEMIEKIDHIHSSLGMHTLESWGQSQSNVLMHVSWSLISSHIFFFLRRKEILDIFSLHSRFFPCTPVFQASHK